MSYVSRERERVSNYAWPEQARPRRQKRSAAISGQYARAELYDMFLLRSALCSATRHAMVARAPARVNIPRLRIAALSSSAGLDRSQIQSRVLEVLKSFEKVDPAKVRFRKF